MKPGIVIAGACALILSTLVVIELVRQSPTAKAIKYVVSPGDGPVVSKSGPYPKAVIDETDFHFGRMEVDEERKHDFIVRNEGEAPLVLKAGKTTCQCTMSKLETTEVAVGQSTKITLTWKPTANAEQFDKGATIFTNEPVRDINDNPLAGNGTDGPPPKEIVLRVLGKVVSRLDTVPRIGWDTPALVDDKPAVVTGSIVSPLLEKFQIVGFDCKSPFVKAVESLPIEKQFLEDNNCLSGFQIRVTVDPGVPIGSFTFPLTIKTDVPSRDADGELGNNIESTVLISGQRRGSIQFLGKPGEWSEENMSVTLGNFDASAGKKATLSMRVKGADAEGFRLTERNRLRTGRPHGNPRAGRKTAGKTGLVPTLRGISPRRDAGDPSPRQSRQNRVAYQSSQIQ